MHLIIFFEIYLNTYFEHMIFQYDFYKIKKHVHINYWKNIYLIFFHYIKAFMLRYFSIMLTRIKRCLLGCAFTLYKPKGDQSLFASIAKVKATTQLDKLGELNTQWCLGPKIWQPKFLQLHLNFYLFGPLGWPLGLWTLNAYIKVWTST